MLLLAPAGGVGGGGTLTFTIDNTHSKMRSKQLSYSMVLEEARALKLEVRHTPRPTSTRLGPAAARTRCCTPPSPSATL